MENNFIYLAESIPTCKATGDACLRTNKLISEAYTAYVEEMNSKGFTELTGLYFVPEYAVRGLCILLNIPYDELKFYKEFDRTFATYTAAAKDSPLANLRGTTIIVIYQNPDVYNVMMRGRTSKWFVEKSDLLLKTVNDFGTFYEQNLQADDAVCLFEAAAIAQFRRAYKVTLDLRDPLPEARFDVLIRGIASAYMSYVAKECRKTIEDGWLDLDTGSNWFNDSYYAGTIRVMVGDKISPVVMKHHSTGETFTYDTLPIFIYGNKVYDFENDYLSTNFDKYIEIVREANPHFWFDSSLCYGKLWDEDVKRQMHGVERIVTK